MAYDFEQWVEASIAERRYRWVRWTLAIGVAATLAWPALRLIGAEADGTIWSGLARLIALAGVLTLFWSPFNRAVWRSRANAYDEREQLLLLRARADAYTFGGGLAIFAVLWCAIAAPRGWPMPRTPDDWQSLISPIALTIVSLPILIAEWRTPFPPAAEQSL